MPPYIGTPGNLVRVAGDYALKIFTRTSGHDLRDIQMSINGLVLLIYCIFGQFHTYFEKSDNDFPNNFYFCSGKNRCGLENKKKTGWLIVLLNFTRRRVVQYSCFDFFPVRNKRIFLAVWAMKYLFNILNKTYCNLRPVEIHKMLNFPNICSGD